MDVVVWLRSLGLGKYEAAFRENHIDETALPSLSHENLKELGIASFGHRVKLLDAIAALRDDTVKTPSAGPVRRRQLLRSAMATAAAMMQPMIIMSSASFMRSPHSGNVEPWQPGSLYV